MHRGYTYRGAVGGPGELGQVGAARVGAESCDDARPVQAMHFVFCGDREADRGRDARCHQSEESESSDPKHLRGPRKRKRRKEACDPQKQDATRC